MVFGAGRRAGCKANTDGVAGTGEPRDLILERKLTPGPKLINSGFYGRFAINEDICKATIIKPVAKPLNARSGECVRYAGADFIAEVPRTWILPQTCVCEL